MSRPLPATLLFFALAACARAPDPAEALAESARHAVDARAVAAVPADGGEIRRGSDAAVPMPADFPRDVVLPDDYTVVSVTTMGPARSVVLRSDDPVPVLFDRFRAGQAARGWKETVSMRDAEGAMLGFSKGRRGIVAHFRTDMGGRTVVSLSLQPQLAVGARQP